MFAAVGIIHPECTKYNINNYKNQWIYYRNDRDLWDGRTTLSKQGKGFRVGEIITIAWDSKTREI